MMYCDFPLASAGDSPRRGVFLFFFFYSKCHLKMASLPAAFTRHSKIIGFRSPQRHLPALFNGRAIQALKISIEYIHVDCLALLIFYTEGMYILRFL